MVAVIGAIEIIFAVDVQAVRPAEQAFAPAFYEIALAVEHDHRMGASIEDVDAILAVDGYRGHVCEIPALGQFRPVLYDAIAMLARAENDRHVSPQQVSPQRVFESRSGRVPLCDARQQALLDRL